MSMFTTEPRPSNTARAIQLDKQCYDLMTEAELALGTYSNPNTCAETHVEKIAQKLINRAEFIKHLADGFAKLDE